MKIMMVKYCRIVLIILMMEAILFLLVCMCFTLFSTDVYSDNSQINCTKIISWDLPWDYTNPSLENDFMEEDSYYEGQLPTSSLYKSSGTILGIKETADGVSVYCSDNNILTFDNNTTVLMNGEKISYNELKIGYRVSYNSVLINPTMPGYAEGIDIVIVRSPHGNIIDNGKCGVSYTDDVRYNLFSDGTVFIYGNGEIRGGAFKDNIEIVAVNILPGITAIGENAFVNCDKMCSINIPSTVINIEESAGLNIGGELCKVKNPFFDCDNLKSIQVADGNSVYEGNYNCNVLVRTEDKTLIAGCVNSEIYNGIKKIGSGAFYNCLGLMEVEFPESLKVISKYAFGGCVNLKNIRIPSNVDCIDDLAFFNCNHILLCVENSSSINLSVSNVDYKLQKKQTSFPARHNIKMLYGDFDMDNKLTLTDVNTSLKLALGIKEISEEDLFYGDVDGEGITLSDTVKYLGMALGIEKTLETEISLMLPESYNAVKRIFCAGQIIALTEIEGEEDIKCFSEDMFEDEMSYKDQCCNVYKIKDMTELSFRQRIYLMEMFDVTQEDFDKYYYYKVNFLSDDNYDIDNLRMYLLPSNDEHKNTSLEIYFGMENADSSDLNIVNTIYFKIEKEDILDIVLTAVL